MSRCFPYPPPGYERKNGAYDEALIESIKLQREREKAKKERKKEKKREKKEEKEREKARENGEIEEKKQRPEKRHKNERRKVDQKGGEHQKRRKDGAEQLEKSSLTEEHGQPTSFQNLYDSSDSTQNSHKRRKHSSPSNSSHSHGSVLRIRLPLLNHKDQEVPPSKKLPCSTSGSKIISQGKYEIDPRLNKEQHCSTSRGTNFVGQEKCGIDPKLNKEQHCSTSEGTNIVGREKYEIDPRLNKEKHCSTSGGTNIVGREKYKIDPRLSKEQHCPAARRTDIFAQEMAETAPRSSVMRIETQYRDLINMWAPLPIQSERNDFDDQEWLFERTQYHGHEAKRSKPSSDGLSYGISNLWPRACYLPEADIYALPFTVPF